MKRQEEGQGAMGTWAGTRAAAGREEGRACPHAPTYCSAHSGRCFSSRYFPNWSSGEGKKGECESRAARSPAAASRRRRRSALAALRAACSGAPGCLQSLMHAIRELATTVEPPALTFMLQRSLWVSPQAWLAPRDLGALSMRVQARQTRCRALRQCGCKAQVLPCLIEPRSSSSSKLKVDAMAAGQCDATIGARQQDAWTRNQEE